VDWQVILGSVNFILGGAGLEKRKYPMQTEVACGMKEEISLKMAGGFTGVVSMPSCPPVNDDCIGYGETVRLQGRNARLLARLEAQSGGFSPKQYLTLKQTLKSTEYDERKVPCCPCRAKARRRSHEAKADSALRHAGRIRCEDFEKPQGARR
jgi:hypothetical protein